jgi:cyanophycin synthetase
LQPIGFARVEEHGEHLDFVWQTSAPYLSRRGAAVAFMGVLDLLQDQDGSFGGGRLEFETSLAAILDVASRRRLSGTASLMKYVALERGLPVEVVAMNQMRIGHGRAQRHIVSSMTDSTSIVAQKFCSDKRLGNSRLAELRLPVPQHIKVASVDAAREAAVKLGFPVVVKPLTGHGGQGVTVGVQSIDQVDGAFLNASRFAPYVLVEEFVQGLDHRLVAINGKFAGAICRRPPVVVGDGKKTARQLIEELNSDPLRDGIIMVKVNPDDEVEGLLKQQGLTFDSVLAAGQAIPLRHVANLSLGGVSEDCTDLVHEDNRDLAERTARGLFLDVAGMDFITTDISRSYREVGGRIIEVNARPGLLMHMWPARGTSRNLAAKVFDRIYPLSESAQIPIVAVAGDRGTGTAGRMLAQLLRGCGKSTGLTVRESAYVNGQSRDLDAVQKRVAPTTLLCDPDVEVLVSAISLRRISQRGLQIDSCSLAIVLDRHKDGNAEQFHTGISVVERATADAFVVGGGNRLALEHLKNLGKRKLIVVGNRITDPLVQDHIARGDTVIAEGWADDADRFILMQGGREIARFPLDDAWLRLTKGKARKLRKVAKYSIAAAFGLGITVADISAGLERSRGAVPEDA